MDKSSVRDVRRGASRFSPAKRQINKLSGGGHKLLPAVAGGGGGDALITEKSKREKLRRLSVVGRASSRNEDCEMGSFGSDREGELPSKTPSTSSGNCKKFKIPRKFFDDCSTVDHASVPRKLRSAMKKRNRESISPPLPDSKKSHTIKGVKKSKKQEDSNQSPRRAISGPITKDEEEVVETLYALAGMFPNNDMTDKSKLKDESLEMKPSTLSDARENAMPAFKVAKEEWKSMCPSATAKAMSTSSDVEETQPLKTVKVNSLNDPTILELPNLSSGKQYEMELATSGHQVKGQTTSLMCKSETVNEKHSCESFSAAVPLELNLETRLKEPKQQGSPFPERKPDIKLDLAKTFGCQLQQQDTVMESKKNGSVLCPDLPSTTSTVSHSFGVHGPLQSSAARNPAWPENATCAIRPRSFESGFSTEKFPRVTVGRWLHWKRCAAHVYISHLVRGLQIPDRKDGSPTQFNQSSPVEGSKQGLMAANNIDWGVRSSSNGVGSACGTSSSIAVKSPNEARNDILLRKRLNPSQQQDNRESMLYTAQKQSFDFLSLSTGGTGLDANNTTRRAGNGLESFSQVHIPHLHALAQPQTLMPVSLSQTRYSSSPYPDQLSAAAAHQVQLQLPPLLGNPFCGPPHVSPTASTDQLQQQQRIWAAQLATHYRPGVAVSSSSTPNWQNGRLDSSSLIQSAQAIIPASPSSLEVLGPKYAPILPQQQQLIPLTSSLPPARSKRQHHHLPSGYEETGGGFPSDGVLPLQLLCNEHI